ncbi:MAG: hypothetical protein ABIH86_02640 [Planctomycetota bacterium]
MAKKRRWGLYFVLVLVVIIGLFLSGFLQKWMADGARKATISIENKHFPGDEIQTLDACRSMPANSVFPDEYYNFLTELHKKDPGRLFRIAAKMYSFCLMDEDANTLRFEFLRDNGIMHPQSVAIWYSITYDVAGKTGSGGGDQTFTMGLIFYRLFWNEHVRMTGAPHPEFRKYEPLIVRRLQSKDQTYSPPVVEDGALEIPFGNVTTSNSEMNRIVRGLQALDGNYPAIKEFGIDRWFNFDMSAW